MGTKFYKAKIAICLESGRVGAIKLFFAFVLFLSSPFSTFSQTNLSFTTITTDFPAPGKGAQNWGEHNWDDIYQPTIPSGNSVAKNYYTRFNWLDIESNTVQGSYSWSVFDAYVQQAMAAGAMFSFGIMNLCDGCGTGGLIPTYLHNLMQAESVQDWYYSADGIWIPNYNSPSFITRYAALMRAVANHIASSSYNGHSYTSAFLGYDIRSYGDFGEGHTFPWGGSEPNNNVIATDASLIRLIDSALVIFPNVQLTVPMNYEAPITSEYGINGNPGILTAYTLLTSSNAYGRIGWRRDNIGDDGYNSYFSANTGAYNPGSGNVTFQTLLMNNWQVAPIGGEPAFDGGAITRSGPAMYDMHNEDMLFHMSYFGNGNYPFYSASGTDWTNMVTNVRAASAEEGYKLILTSGSMTTTLASGGPFNITLNWQDIGIAPVYEKWNVTFELRKSDGTVVWTGNSAFNPRLFLPQPSATAMSDNFNLTSVAAGTYSMYLIIRDPANYKQPLPLAISGRNSDGSYLLRSNIIVGTGGPVNQPPTANAGADQTIQLPASTVSLTGVGTDADGTITTYAWSKVSGPAGANITTPGTANSTVTGLIQGVYNFALTVTDNQGATGSDTIKVTVNAAVATNQPPIANAGSDQTITLPTNSATLNGTASSDPDGSIAAYQWTKISGPAQYALVNNTAASTIVNNLTAGSYSFQLKVTDNSGAVAMDTIKIIVNAAPANQPPVANAGADITITLPTNIANLNGSASSDPDGTIAVYAWNQVSGPSAATIASATTAQSNVTGLIQGVYIFALTVTDNSGASKSDSVKVTVNPAANIPPVANAGTSKSITLPTSSVVLDGSLSSDPDGSIVTYAWTQTAGPSTATILGGNLATATASNLVAGQYTFQLTVTDNGGATSSAKVKITVVASGIQPPIANAGADQTITLPTNSATIDGSGSTAPSGSIVSYNWTEKSGPSSVGLSNTAQNALTNLKAGVYIFTLTVTDNNAKTGSDSVIITVNPAANIPPVSVPGTSVSLTLPVNSTTLDGSGSYDPDGTISSYQWNIVSGPNSPTASGASTAKMSLTGLIAGKYIYRLTVTDNNGASSSALINIIVTAAANIPPVANAGSNQSITAPASTVILNGSASYDPDGTIKTYNWVTISGPGSITINNSNTATPSVIGLQTGIYTFQLTVTDNSGASTSDQMFVTVLPQVVLPNQSPVANAGTNQTITSPVSSVSLNGTSSFDPDGTITAYSWSQVSGPSSATISAANTSSPTVSQLIVGQYVFQLTVTDNNGATNTDQVTVTVNPGVEKVDLPPVANAGTSDTISLPTDTYMLNASQSSDPDGTIESYQWQQLSGPNTASSSKMSGQKVSIGDLQVGQYEFQVTVTDNAGTSSIATMKLTVMPSVADNNDQLAVYPNPAHDVITSKVTSDVTGSVKIYVYDMNGQMVMATEVEKSSDVIRKTMNISTLAAGMYTIQVNIANRKIMVTKFIKD